MQRFALKSYNIYYNIYIIYLSSISILNFGKNEVCFFSRTEVIRSARNCENHLSVANAFSNSNLFLEVVVELLENLVSVKLDCYGNIVRTAEYTVAELA